MRAAIVVCCFGILVLVQVTMMAHVVPNKNHLYQDLYDANVAVQAMRKLQSPDTEVKPPSAEDRFPSHWQALPDSSTEVQWFHVYDDTNPLVDETKLLSTISKEASF